MQGEIGSLPRHAEMGRAARALEAVSIAAALALLLLHAIRFGSEAPAFGWTTALAIAAGALLADLGSGLVHWGADTWGRESLPVIGRRFLHPFRIHHQNPRDILRRGFIDCNGDVAMLTCPLLVGAWLVPVAEPLERDFAAALVALGAVALPTNQIHQWAHMPDPPAAVAWLQRRGLILSPARHDRHHERPYASNYCITTGWCNAALDALGLFRGLERAITRLTGLEPRRDERRSADPGGA